MNRADLINRLRTKFLLSQVALALFVACCIVTFFTVVFTVGAAAGRSLDEAKINVLIALFAAPLGGYAWYVYGRIAKAIRQEWMVGYGGTEWITPAGERGQCDHFEDLNGLLMALKFEDGSTTTFNFGDLSLADPRLAGLLPLRGTKAFVRPRDYGYILGPWIVGTISLAHLAYFFGSGPFGDAAMAFTIAVGLLFVPVFLVVSDFNVNCSGSDALLKEYSKFRWKAEDGEVGTLRTVRRHTNSDNRNIHVDYLTVAFPSGVRKIERARLIPA